MLFSQTTPDESPPTPPPGRWSALITVPTHAKFQLVWCRPCDDVLFLSPCLVEHTLTAVCMLPKYQRGRKCNAYSYMLWPNNVLHIFDPACIVLKSGWSSTARMPLLVVRLPPLSPFTPRRHRQADGQLSLLYTHSPSFSSFGAAGVKLCCLPPPSLVRNARFCCLVNVWHVEDDKVVFPWTWRLNRLLYYRTAGEVHYHLRRADWAPQTTASFTRGRRRALWYIWWGKLGPDRIGAEVFARAACACRPERSSWTG